MGSLGRRIALVVALFAILLLPMSSPALATSIGLDPTFDTDGKAVTVFEQASLVTSIAVYPDGKIVAGGWSIDGSFNQFFHPCPLQRRWVLRHNFRHGWDRHYGDRRGL